MDSRGDSRLGAGAARDRRRIPETAARGAARRVRTYCRVPAPCAISLRGLSCARRRQSVRVPLTIVRRSPGTPSSNYLYVAFEFSPQTSAVSLVPDEAQRELVPLNAARLSRHWRAEAPASGTKRVTSAVQ